MTTRQLVDSTPAPRTRKAKLLRLVDYTASYLMYAALTILALAVLGFLGRVLWLGLQLGWHLGSKLFGL